MLILIPNQGLPYNLPNSITCEETLGAERGP